MSDSMPVNSSECFVTMDEYHSIDLSAVRSSPEAAKSAWIERNNAAPFNPKDYDAESDYTKFITIGAMAMIRLKPVLVEGTDYYAKLKDPTAQAASDVIELCAAIEALPASEQQTAISLKAAALSALLNPPK